jgi:hypothetical protein
MSGYNAIVANQIHKSDMIIICPDREFYMSWGWLDSVNFIPVGIIRYGSGFYADSYSTAYAWSDTDYLMFSYGGAPVLVESAGGNKYWVFSGYGWDGDKFRSWSYDTFPNGLCLNETGEIIFGTYSLDNNENVGSIILSDIADQVYIPSGGCKLVCLVSNNNGDTWEKYDYNSEIEYIFQSTGNNVKVKFVIYGKIYNAPHINSNHYINVTLIERNYISRRKRIYRSKGNLKGI